MTAGPRGEGRFAPNVKLRHRDPQRCGSCGAMWSSRWYQVRGWPAPLCADCNCPCHRRGVDHDACTDRLVWTGQESTDHTLATRRPGTGADQLQLPL